MEPVLALIFLAMWLLLLIIPIVRILRRLGFNEWYALVALIPLFNIFGLWALAFNEWPAVHPPSPRQLDEWSDADKELFRQMLERQGR